MYVEVTKITLWIILIAASKTFLFHLGLQISRNPNLLKTSMIAYFWNITRCIFLFSEIFAPNTEAEASSASEIKDR